MGAFVFFLILLAALVFGLLPNSIDRVMERYRGVTFNTPPFLKYRDTVFDRSRNLYLTDADIFLTSKNNCPLVFNSRDGQALSANIQVAIHHESKKRDSDTMTEELASRVMRLVEQQVGNLASELTTEYIVSNPHEFISKVDALVHDVSSQLPCSISSIFLINRIKEVSHSRPLMKGPKGQTNIS